MHFSTKPGTIRKAPPQGITGHVGLPSGNGTAASVDRSIGERIKVKSVKPLAVFINAIAFSALFVVYGSGGAIERPAGIRRALQTYAKELPTGGSAMFVPDCQFGTDMSDLV